MAGCLQHENCKAARNHLMSSGAGDTDIPCRAVIIMMVPGHQGCGPATPQNHRRHEIPRGFQVCLQVPGTRRVTNANGRRRWQKTLARASNEESLRNAVKVLPDDSICTFGLRSLCWKVVICSSESTISADFVVVGISPLSRH